MWSPADAAYRGGRRMRKAGIVLTCVGVPLTVLAVVAIAATGGTCSEPDQGENWGCLGEILGYGLAIVGAGSLATGVALWTVGARRMRQALQMGATGLTLAPGPRRAAGVSLRWTF